MDRKQILKAIKALPKEEQRDLLWDMEDLFPVASFVAVDIDDVRARFKDLDRADRDCRLRFLTPSVVSKGMEKATHGDWSHEFSAALDLVCDAVIPYALEAERKHKEKRNG